MQLEHNTAGPSGQ